MINIIQNTIGVLQRRVSSAASIITQNLQLWLDFEKSEVIGGELVVKDKSPNTNNAKLFTGKAMSFDGVNDYVDVSAGSYNAYTLAFYVKTLSSGNQWLVGSTTWTGQLRQLKLNGGNLMMYTGDGWHTLTGTLNDGAWHRVVVTYDGTTNKMYTDNNDVASWNTATYTSGKLDTIGSKEGTTVDSLDGSMADVQFYNAAWTQSDVTFDYNNPNHLVIDNPDSTIALSNLKGYWALSEGGGSIAYDSSGNGNDGTSYDGGGDLVGTGGDFGNNDGTIYGATYVDKQPTIPQLGMMDWSKPNISGSEITLIQAPNNKGFDILGNALRLRDHGFNLDGSGYAEVADDATLNISNGTIQFWLKTSQTKFNILKGQSTSEFIGQTDNGVWSFGNAGTITSYIDNATASTQPLYDDSWHFYTFTGVDLSTWTTHEISNLAGFEIDGIIDEVLIYNSVLSTSDIQNNYSVGLVEHSASSSYSDDYASDYGF